MSDFGLNKLVWEAMVNEGFQKGVLNGRRAELIQGMDLDPDEATEVMAIQAGSLEEFAAGVQAIIDSRKRRKAPAWGGSYWMKLETALAGVQREPGVIGLSPKRIRA